MVSPKNKYIEVTLTILNSLYIYSHTYTHTYIYTHLSVMIIMKE